ncbi:hypothetical protein L6R50_08935 [Myxococcota bacterium]|nr:hypothetical protein [Myxococcota bacterium]
MLQIRVSRSAAEPRTRPPAIGTALADVAIAAMPYWAELLGRYLTGSPGRDNRTLDPFAQATGPVPGLTLDPSSEIEKLRTRHRKLRMRVSSLETDLSVARIRGAAHIREIEDRLLALEGLGVSGTAAVAPSPAAVPPFPDTVPPFPDTVCRSPDTVCPSPARPSPEPSRRRYGDAA